MRLRTICFTLILLLGTLAACGAKDQVYPPEEIQDGIDRCEVCNMLVPNNHHATQILLNDGRSLKFDDIGDLAVWLKEHGEDDVNARYVRDYHSEEWLLIEEAFFVYDAEIRTPMAYGVISFQSEEDAKAYMESEGRGELYTYEELQQHSWVQNMDLMDHHHDHEHHGHHEHGSEHAQQEHEHHDHHEHDTEHDQQGHDHHDEHSDAEESVFDSVEQSSTEQP